MTLITRHSSLATHKGLFVGLVTLDLVYLAESPPQNNQKIVASDYNVTAGGPATNAAVTFSYLGDRAKLLSVLGNNKITQLLRADLESYKVEIADLAPTQTQPPPISSIIVSQATGERAVISVNAVKNQVDRDRIPSDILQDVDIILIDGHQIAVGLAIATLATENIPVVIDGGSWKSGFERILPFVDYAICSANFYPPGCRTKDEVFAYLSKFNIPHIAITDGEKPISILSENETATLEVPQIKAVDTSGAGDIFHGAFCYYILRDNFINALQSAAKIAASACEVFGTRRWMENQLS